MKKTQPPNLMSETMAALMVPRLGSLKYFPKDDAAREPVIDLLMAMCETEDRAAWLVRRMTSGIYNEWPGLREMRACYCTRYKPKDGIEVYSQYFEDNIFPTDPEAPAPRLESYRTTPLLEWEPPTAAPPERQAPPPAMAEPTSTQQDVRSFKPITQADVDRAVEENHRKKEQANASPDTD